MNLTYKLFSITFTTFVVSACGGGGGGTAPVVIDTPQTQSEPQYTLVQPTLLTALPATGVPTSSIKVLDFGMGSVSFPSKISWSWSAPLDFTYTFAGTTVSPIIFEPIGRVALSSKAWDSGWSGKGTTISVVDDFTTGSILYSINFENISRSYNFLTSGEVHGKRDQANANIMTDINYTVASPYSSSSYSYSHLTMTHGDLVESIAGGNGQGNIVSKKIELKYKGDKVTSCSIVSNWSPYVLLWSAPLRCSDFDSRSLSRIELYQNTILGNENNVIANYKKTPGIAKDALVVKNNVLLGAGANPIKLVSDIQGHLLNSKKTDVINLSMGAEIPTNGQTFTQVMDAVAKFPIPKLEAVVVVAAGNGGAPCASLDLSGCNALAVSMAFQESTGSSTIIAGALQGEGLNENIAVYSTRAGILADRYLLAPGDSGYIKIIWYYEEYNKVAHQIGSESVKGTSFAAPIISGAAALINQKYPSLSSKQVADVLLLSANKDINNDGIPDFSGVSAIYGHGKLDINRALSLAGAIK